jgi:hypothetical protein
MKTLAEISDFIKDYIKTKGLKEKPSHICYSWDDFFHTQPRTPLFLKIRDVCLGIARVYPGEEDEKGRSEYYNDEGFALLSELAEVLQLGEQEAEAWLDEKVKTYNIYLSEWRKPFRWLK